MALDLGTMYAKVELDRRDYQQGMKEIPQQAETAFKQVASLAGKWLSAQILVGGLNDWQKEFSASLNKGVENALRIAVVGETARQTAEKIQAAEALKQAAMKKSMLVMESKLARDTMMQKQEAINALNTAIAVEKANLRKQQSNEAAARRHGRTLLRSRGSVKKWQSCKDSNLNKVNQNHLCYRYTTGLRIFYFVVLSNITAFRNKASSNFNFFQTFIPAETESRAGFCRKYRKKGCKNSFPASL